MQVTFTNTTSDPLYLPSLYISLDAGKSVTTRRAWADIDRDQALKKHIQAGSVTLVFAKELGDDADTGFDNPLKAYSNATRPAANTVPMFTAIWNTNDNAANWSDGTDWRDNAGIIT